MQRNYLAIGTESGNVQLWDMEHQKRVRTLQGHSARVGVLAWNECILKDTTATRVVDHHRSLS